MKPSSWTLIKMTSPKRAQREILLRLERSRRYIARSKLRANHKKLILRRLDEYADWAEAYTGRLVLFTKFNFKRLWEANLYIFMSSKTKDKCHNSAAMEISGVLRKFGYNHGFLKKQDLE